MQQRIHLIILMCLLVMSSVMLNGCEWSTQEQTPISLRHPWPLVLQQAQLMATNAHADAVIESIQVTEVISKNKRELHYYFVFTSTSGGTITIHADNRPNLIMETAPSTGAPSPEELQLLKESITKVHISPSQVFEIGASFIDETERQSSLTLPITCALMLGSTIKQDYGLPVVWLINVVNSKQHAILAIDAATGKIVGEQRTPR